MTFEADTALVERINSRTRLWRQGDVVSLGAMAWLASPNSPLTSQSAAVASEDLSCVVAAADRLAVVTQTCDIVRDCSTRPFVTLARVVRLDDSVASEARRGSRPRFVPLPGLGEDAFADMDLVVTVEKSVLFALEPTQGLPDEPAQRRFGAGVARAFSRFAFPDDLTVALRGMVARVRDKHARNSVEGRALAVLEEIRVTGAPAWDAEEVNVFITFAPPTRADADEVMTEQQWDDVVDRWVRRAEPFGVIRSIDGAMIPLDELTAREYRDSDALDLDYLSWN